MDSRTTRYSYQVQWSDEDNAYIATCAEFPSVSAFADSPQDALTEVMQVIDASVELLEEEGEEPPEPMVTKTYSGTLSLRLPPTTHRDVAIAAAHENVSLNQYITSQLERSSSVGALPAAIQKLEKKVDRIEAKLSSGSRWLQRLPSVWSFSRPSPMRRYLLTTNQVTPLGWSTPPSTPTQSTAYSAEDTDREQTGRGTVSEEEELSV